MLFKPYLGLIIPLTNPQSIEWPREIIDDENFTVIHEVTVRKYVVDLSFTVSA